MKTTVLIMFFCLVSLFTFAIQSIKGDSNSRLNQYQVTQIGENLYQLTYSNSGETFTIEVCKKRNECCYLLRNEKIEVMYLCSEDGFGLRKMPEKLKKIDTSVYKHLLDPNSFQQQSVLSNSLKNETQALGLIACFFPNCINPESFDLAFKTSKPANSPELSLQK
jgi:hypothetical protein